MTYSLAVDIGGTFTDIVLRHDDGRLYVDKTLTTHEDLLTGFFAGVDAVMARAGVVASAIDGVVVHATTVVTNALIERKGPPTALVVTEGFRDVLSIRNEHRYDMYDPQIEFPDPLVPAALTFGLAERTLADGTVALTPTDTDVARLADLLAASGAEAVAICFLNSFVNPANETRVARALAARLEGRFVCTSSDIAPQIREYQRASTVVVNAYTMPISQPYLRALSDRLRREGFSNTPLIMLSSGGVVGAETAGRNPVRMIESGPAAGALAACHYARVLGIERLMSFDMGGTTAKACLIEGGTPLVAGLFEVDRRYRFKEGSGLPVIVPSIDLIEIGAGGGKHRPCRRARPAQGRSGKRRFQPWPGLLWAWRQPGDGHRRRPDARPHRRRQLPRRRHAPRRGGERGGDAPARRRARHLAPSGGARRLSRRHRGDGLGRARPRHRSRRRLSRHAAVRLRRRRAAPRLRGRRTARQRLRRRGAAVERALGVRHAGDAVRLDLVRSDLTPARRHRLGACRGSARRP